MSDNLGPAPNEAGPVTLTSHTNKRLGTRCHGDRSGPLLPQVFCRSCRQSSCELCGGLATWGGDSVLMCQSFIKSWERLHALNLLYLYRAQAGVWRDRQLQLLLVAT